MTGMQAQLALVTQRPGMKARYAAAGVAVAVYPVQEGGQWPQIPDDLPIVLDTIDMPPAVLIQLLAWVPDTLFVIAAPENWCTLRLLAMSQDVQLVVPDKPEAIRRCLRYLTCLIGETGWLVPPAPSLSLAPDPQLLRGLAALCRAKTMQEAAELRGSSVSTLGRQLQKLRRALGLPSGQEKRRPPALLLLQILERLGTWPTFRVQGTETVLQERELAA